MSEPTIYASHVSPTEPPFHLYLLRFFFPELITLIIKIPFLINSPIAQNNYNKNKIRTPDL